MVRCSIFFVLVDGSKLGDAGSGDGGLRERQKKWQVEGEAEELRCRRERNLIISNMNTTHMHYQWRTPRILRLKAFF